MGLLDDAIREHLELKRLRGADPGDVARQERDALGQVRRDGETEPEEHDTDRSSFRESEPAEVSDSLNTGQETIEINMEAELAADSDSGHKLGATRPGSTNPFVHPADSQAASGESLEWEMPGDRPDKQANIELGEADSRVSDDPNPAEHIEDVLEETPDFLSDTPEQERLWFEQRPPRDFDFNE
jgi:hypothetical protein